MFGLRKNGRKSGRKSGRKGGKSVRSGSRGNATGAAAQTLRRGYSRSPIRTARKLFHGVSIRPGEASACEAARDLAGVRFLADDAPMLPLADCSNPSGCRCRYQHYDDRRTDARRESDVGLPMKNHPDDARTGAGRRVTDG